MITPQNILIKKYNVPGPRYTSYPTVPYWDNAKFSHGKWTSAISGIFQNNEEEISIYVHLPYCESLCTFCGCNTRITVNHAVEAPYMDAVIKEWKMYTSLMKRKPVIKEIHLGGGTPTFFSPENLKKLITGILEGNNVSKFAEFGFEGHPNNTTAIHLQTLYDLGFKRVSFGIQDFDEKVQVAINRIQPFENVRKVTETARSIGYSSINYDIVYGLPLQTMNGMIDTIRKVNLLKPDRIAFYSYAHVPWIKPGQRKFTELDLPDDEAKRDLYEKGREMLEAAGYFEIGMDHFALSSDTLYHAFTGKKLHRNFMGYTTTHTSRLIGLGVSSISDIWNGYAQNVKTVEEYKSMIDRGQLPVFKGHFLNDEDLILRQHILNLMCRFKTSWNNPSEQCHGLFDGLNRMRSIEKDNLVTIGLSELEITDRGRPFLRNICMCLDARMHDQVGKNVQFSKVI